MELPQLVLLLGFIGEKVIRTNSELQPAPHLTLDTHGDIRRGQSVVLTCTAPTSHREGTYYLYIQSNGLLLAELDAPEDRHSVTFTLSQVSDSGGYLCRYQSWVSGVLQASESSNVLQLIVTDDAVLITSPPSPKESAQGSAWLVPLAAGLPGSAVLVLIAAVALWTVKRIKEKKKQTQREREAVWSQQNMTPGWSYDNMVFSAVRKPTSEIGLPPPYPGRGETRVERNEEPFSSFRTSAAQFSAWKS
ncbi:uncharacterized protein LOC142471392 [Ascaphus truei]|uniref:uncharacterized protein LOC142471392 n=1 Tax=Ascaphus truei TaxID=8439 RepID=UPI003F592080